MDRTVQPDRKDTVVTLITPVASSTGLMITPPPIPQIAPTTEEKKQTSMIIRYSIFYPPVYRKICPGISIASTLSGSKACLSGCLSGLLLPAVFSIGVHYYGWDEARVKEYIASYFGDEAAEELAPLYIEIALGDAFYYLEYALGYSLLQQELRDAEAELGEKFDLRAFNEAFLSIGPSYFNLVEPRMDAWVASMKG